MDAAEILAIYIFFLQNREKGGDAMDDQALSAQVWVLTDGVPQVIADLANASAAIWQALENTLI